MSEMLTRQEQKERTREALLAAALKLSATDGFGQVSLRNITREAGVVPTTFYRHFDSMDELGLTLVHDSFVTLRTMIRDAQRDAGVWGDLIRNSVDILAEAARTNREHFRFIARERTGGSALVREAIGRELDLFISELALPVGRLPALAEWSAEDVMALSGIFVRNMVYRAENLVEIADSDQKSVDELKEKARRDLRMIVLGIPNWKSR